MRVVYAFIAATPGNEPTIPPLVHFLSHHLHCVMHSAVVAAVVGLIAWRVRGALWVPLVGWWLHIALDIPTHSDDYYAVPFLYPFTYWGMDGVPWTTPWLLVLNYSMLAVVYWVLWRTRPVQPAAR